jgi:uncharacterized protein (DUF1778 family)
MPGKRSLARVDLINKMHNAAPTNGTLTEITMTFHKAANPKTDRLYCRVTDEQKKEIHAKANDCAMTTSEFLLKSALGKQTRTRQDVLVINQLMLLGSQLRDIYASEAPRAAEELQPVLDAVVRAIDRVGNGSAE